jgi:putative flippase GtrA
MIAGVWNTAFGYASLAVLYYLFSNQIQYMFLVVFSTIVNITNAYLCHKFFVFKTKGNYLKEYLRYYIVYSIPIGMSLVLLPFCIEILKMNFYVTQAIITVFTVFISYFGHKHVSFRQSQ